MPDPQSPIETKQDFEEILSRIQPNILRGHGWKHARYHFMRIDDPEQFRPALLAALETFPIGTAAAFSVPTEAKPARAVNVAFTHGGLRALQVAPGLLKDFPEAFREGMAVRCRRLGDDGESAPEHWDRCHGSDDVHVLISLFYAETADFDASWREFVAAAGGTDGGAGGGVPSLPGSQLLVVEKGDRLYENADEKGAPIEHFGFRDGISQPALRDGSSPNGGGWVDKDGTWKPIETGEFLLGHPDMDGFDQLALTPKLVPLCQDGTYLVFRKLRQRVVEFQKFLDEKFEPEQRELMAARMVGRWKNGDSLVNHPESPGRAAQSDSENDFRYEPSDADGMKCPMASHVRRANPRDSHPDLGVDPRAVARRRIIRRGIPYGDAKEEAAEKGLLFFCFNARIDAQFEFLQEEWINRGDFVGHYSSVKDPIIGANGGEKDVLALPSGPIPAPKLPRFVTTRGGEYFFMPSVQSLTGMLEGRIGADPGTVEPVEQHTTPTDPVKNAERLDVAALHVSRDIACLPFDRVSHHGVTTKRNWYYVVGYDQIVDVLDDESSFTVDHTSLRLEALLHDPDPDSDQQDYEKQMLLGLPGEHAEKKRRHAILRGAFASQEDDVSSLFEKVEKELEEAAYATARCIIAVGAASPGSAGRGFSLDIARDLARLVPLKRVERYYGIQLPDAISDLHKAWHFRQIPERDRNWLRAVRAAMKARKVGPSEGLAEGLVFEDLDWAEKFPPVPEPLVGLKELGFLAGVSAIALLIDVYNTGELFDIGKLAIRDLRRHVSDCVDRPGATTVTPGTLLYEFIEKAPAESDPAARDAYLRRVKLLLLEMIVGGVETPAKGIVNTVDVLLSHPVAMEAARSAVRERNREALDDVIHEALRLDPVAVLLYRLCPNGATLGKANDAVIEPGSMVALVLRDGYRDPEQFQVPDAFQLGRPARTDDPGFGRDPHVCLGRLIAMAEIRGVLRALLDGYELQRVPGVAGRKRERLRFPESMGVKLYPTA